MNSRYQTEDDLQDFQDTRGEDREISLGTTTILGIFFALALLCAVFFGFGYSMGRRSAPPVVSAAETSALGAESSSSKPAPGSLAARTASPSPTLQVDTSESPVASDTPAPSTEEGQPAPTPAPVRAIASSFHPDVRAETAVKLSAKPAAAAPIASSGVAVSIVQVAAVSHQEDADVLVNALKHRGYSVAIHKEPQDKLLHVQIGPFSTKKDADAMRQRLQTDGYNAIVK